MKKAIINKHVDNVSDIRLNRGLFVSDDILAKGELIICNDADDPSIYILDTKGNVSKISGGISIDDIPTYDDTELRELINDNKQDLKNNISSLRSEIISENEELGFLISRIHDIIGTIESGKTISESLNELSESVEVVNEKVDENKVITDNYTVNGKKISDSPVIDSDDLLVSNNYTTFEIDGNLSAGDKFTNALSKLEVMIKNTTLALTASVIDLESKIGNETEYDKDGNIVKNSSGLFKKYEELESRIQ